MEDEQRQLVIPFAGPEGKGPRMTIEWPHVRMRLFELNEDQLQGLKQGANSASLGLLGLFGGIAFSAITTIATVELTDRATAWFVGCLVASAGLTVFFSFQAIREHRNTQSLIARIQEQHPREVRLSTGPS
jgi:hypothetical protein